MQKIGSGLKTLTKGIKGGLKEVADIATFGRLKKNQRKVAQLE